MFSLNKKFSFISLHLYSFIKINITKYRYFYIFIMKEFITNLLFNFDYQIKLQEWLETLSGIELLAFIIFCFNGLILNALVSIVFILYGDFLIRYFKLEEKYPKLAKFIQIRRKLQNFSIKYNLAVIFFCALGPLYASLIVFWHHIF